MQKVPVQTLHASLFAIRKVEGNHEVLLLQREKTLVGEWCQIAGSIEEGEYAWQTALRELNEETGLRPYALYSADVCEQFYDVSRNIIMMGPVFVGFIDVDAKVSLNHEHSDYRWVDFEEAFGMVPFGGQRKILRWIENEFVKRSPSKHLSINF